MNTGLRYKNIILLTVCLLLSSIQIGAQSPGVVLLTGNVQPAITTAYANEAISITGTAGGFTSSLINPTCTDCPINVLRATRADCTTESAVGINFRVTITSTTPTASVGTLIASGTSFSVFGYTNIVAFRAIRTAATSIDMYCIYSRP